MGWVESPEVLGSWCSGCSWEGLSLPVRSLQAQLLPVAHMLSDTGTLQSSLVCLVLTFSWLPASTGSRARASLPSPEHFSLPHSTDLEGAVLILLLHYFSNTNYLSVMFFSILYFLSKVSKFSKGLKPFGKWKDPLLRQ